MIFLLRRFGLGIWVAIETALAFALAHSAFRAFRSFTPWGQREVESGWVFSPGISFMLTAWLALWLSRRLGREPESYWSRPFAQTRMAVRFYFQRRLLLVLLVALAIYLAFPQLPPTWVLASLSVAASLFLCSAGLDDGSRMARWGLTTKIAIVALIVGWFVLGPADGAFVELLWLVFASALGEELFFRGYVQGRWNGVFGKPWRWGGAQFGPGLILASAMFGVVHGLNSFDTFAWEGEWEHHAAWLSGSALFFGLLRERCGGLLTPVLVHASMNMLARMAENVAQFAEDGWWT